MCSLAGNVSAQTGVTMYGSLDAGGAYVSNSAGSALFKFNQSNMQPDRWGFKGVEDLGGGLHSVFRLENGFFTGTGTSVSSGTMWNRQAYVGLASPTTGTLTVGHQSSLNFDLLTPLSNAYLAQSWNAFHPGNFDNLANSATSSIDNAIKYRSANYHGLSASSVFGLGNTANFGFGNTFSIGVDFASGNLKTAAIFSNQHNRAFGVAATGLTTFQGSAASAYVADHSQTFGAGLLYTVGNLRVHGLYTRVRLEKGAASDVYQTYEAGAEYQLTLSNQVTGGVATTTMSGHRWSQVEVGYIYSLSKSTQLYLQALCEHTNAGAKAYLSIAGASSNENQVLVLSGMHHTF